MGFMRLMIRVPGLVALGVVTCTAAVAVFWGVNEMFHEGWWGPVPHRLLYLVPGAVFTGLAVIAARWPRFGGALLMGMAAVMLLGWKPLFGNNIGLTIGGFFVCAGIPFMFDGTFRDRLRAAGHEPVGPWWRRNWRTLIAGGVPLLLALGIVVNWIVILSARVDDGDRTARLIEGNGVRLVWAPTGPGWSEGGRRAGDNLSWDQIALYGVEPVGFGEKPNRHLARASAADRDEFCLCRYLSADGTRLMDTPQDVWRLPTADEIVRSLVIHGENAGGAWGGELGRPRFVRFPDKETPLWAPDRSAIYYWAADEWSDEEAVYVSFNGWVRAQPKNWGNPRHGHRCVKDPGDGDLARRGDG